MINNPVYEAPGMKPQKETKEPVQDMGLLPAWTCWLYCHNFDLKEMLMAKWGSDSQNQSKMILKSKVCT